MKYKDRVLAGDLSPEAIKHHIHLWADDGCSSPLYAYLGLSWQEYVMYRHRPQDFYVYMLVQRNLKRK